MCKYAMGQDEVFDDENLSIVYFNQHKKPLSDQLVDNRKPDEEIVDLSLHEQAFLHAVNDMEAEGIRVIA